MRVVVLLVGLLTCAACGGNAGEERTSQPARFTAAGCRVEDAAFCDQAARAANALVARDAEALVTLSRPELSHVRTSTALLPPRLHGRSRR